MRCHLRGSTRATRAIVFSAVCVLSRVAGADNLTTLSDAAASLISIGGPSFVASEGDFGANGRALNGVDGNPPAYTATLGWTMNATITPDATDIGGGQARLIMEIGGTSNGTGLWLIGGVPTLALKSSVAGGMPSENVASSFIANDLDLTDNAAAIYSSFGALTAGTEYSVAASWDAADGFSLAVQEDSTGSGVVQSATVSGASNSYNWFGNGTFTLGDLTGAAGNYGGLNEITGNPFSTDTTGSFAGTFDDFETLFWNEPSSLSVATPLDVLTVSVNRDTGEVTLSNPSASSVTVDSYSLIGGRGGFDDGGGPMKELNVAGGSLFTIGPGGSQSLGAVWAQSPFSDVSAQIDVAGGGSVNALVAYTGAEVVFGDYDLSGSLDAGDWPTVLSGLVSDVGAEDGIAQYLSGDLTGDGAVDRDDFRFFKDNFNAAFGQGAFEAMIANQVPEPSSLLTLGVLVTAGACGARRFGRRVAAAALAATLCCVTQQAEASDVYFVNGNGEIRSFTGFTDGPFPIDGTNFDSGILEGTVAAYGAYQGFTSTPDGMVYGVNSTGGVDSWDTVASWLAADPATNLSSGVYGALTTTSPRSGVHGVSFDGATGGFYVVYEGPDAQEGDIGVYANLPTFINNTPALVDPSAYNGNILNFYYPDEDAPVTVTVPNADAEPGSNYFQISGAGNLEGWLTLDTPGFGYYAGGGNPGGSGEGGNRSYQLNGFSPGGTPSAPLVAAFATVGPIDDLSLSVDTTTGEVFLKRAPTLEPTIDFFSVSSAGGGLLASGYTGLGGSGVFPQGDGSPTSAGWDQAPSNATNTSEKSEFFAFGDSTVTTAGGLVSLGTFYDTTLNTQDLVLTYDNAADGSSVSVGGVYIEYFASQAMLLGDADGDGDVDGDDLIAVQTEFGSTGATPLLGDADGDGDVDGDDLIAVQTEFGAVLAVAVPEPASLGVLFSALVAPLARRRRRAGM